RNWAGNHQYGAITLHRPRTLEELQEIVSRASSIRALGSRHSFNAIADAGELVTLDDLPHEIEIADDTVTVSANVTYAELCRELHRGGVALHNLASLPHINVAGAVATATHGSGDTLGNLATAVASIDLVTPDGDIATFSRGDTHFDGVVVGLGSLGVVTRLTLHVEPAYDIHQHVYEHLPWSALTAHFDEIFASGY